MLRVPPVRPYPFHYMVHEQLFAHAEPTTALEFSPDGGILASTGMDNCIKIWGGYDGFNRRNMVDYSGGMYDLSWSRDCRALVVACGDGTLKIWDTRYERCVKTLRGHQGAVYCCCYNPRSTMIVSGSTDSTVRIWDVRTGTSFTTLRHGAPVTSVDFNRNGERIASSSYDGTCCVWDQVSGVCETTPLSNYQLVSFVKFIGDDDDIWASTLTSEFKLISRTTHQFLKTYGGYQNEEYHIKANISADGKWAVSGSEDGYIYVWNVETEEVAEKIPGHTGVIVPTACHPRYNIIASAGGPTPGSAIMIWEL